MRLLFIADIVGQPGRRAVKEIVPRMRRELDLHIVIANGENAAGGSGLTPKTAEEIFLGGVDIITTGDHVWDQKEVVGLLENERRCVRPLNYPAGVPWPRDPLPAARHADAGRHQLARPHFYAPD